jgi:amino acid permease (GABA permease)
MVEEVGESSARDYQNGPATHVHASALESGSGSGDSDTEVSLIDAQEFAHMSSEDQKLAEMGYKPVFKREFTMFSAFSFAVSISGLFATIATTFSYPLTSGGPAAVVWCWVVAGLGCLSIAFSVAEIVSAYPTSGGLYFSCNYLVPKKYVAVVAWIDGWINLLGQIAGIASSDYGAAQMLLAAVSMGSDFTYLPTAGHTVGVMAALLTLHGLINTMSTKALERFSNVYVVFHTCILISCSIALLVVQKDKHSAKYVFTEIESSTGWSPKGFSFLFGFLSVAWTMTDYDATAHICEEMNQPERKAPWAISFAMLYTYLIGILFNIVLAFCMGNPNDILASVVDQPVAQIFYNVLGKGGGIFFTVAAFIIMNFVAITALHSSSRTTWAFSRDRMIPLSRIWYKVNKKTGTPIYAVWMNTFFCIAINLIALGSQTTIDAIFNVTAIALDWSYVIPIICKMVFGLFKPGPWHLGRWSFFINLYAAAWTTFVSIIFILPTTMPVTAINMNYAVVFFVGILVICYVYWFVRGRKFYVGPRANTHIASNDMFDREDTEKTVKAPESNSNQVSALVPN